MTDNNRRTLTALYVQLCQVREAIAACRAEEYEDLFTSESYDRDEAINANNDIVSALSSLDAALTNLAMAIG